ncbi:tRNA (5-methylaminomethyl-2-thiouridine)(34)-methyltransferase MnmD [Salibacteraceae bacterium]|jgi:tRNA U34 5-methylaminomethyl-2-thiouridine-forming methyltransferase MnmC|nr:tRNA (5-methylaminomethyl-2-thiouridine)(34)-methyltransferase MnmD [Salibacteraceae bacterium]
MSVTIKNRITDDGSPTLYRPDLDEHYHSTNGAVQESTHVFIEKGLKPIMNKTDSIRILELGFGTGLNALLTEEYGCSAGHTINYIALETVPLVPEIWKTLDYQRPEILKQLHTAAWEEDVTIREGFQLKKHETSFQKFDSEKNFNLIYWDAFGPNKQPELWTLGIFEKCYQLMSPASILVTYCAKGDVRRAMQAAGFDVERLPGPPGKREMLRATKRL